MQGNKQQGKKVYEHIKQVLDSKQLKVYKVYILKFFQ